MRVRAIRCGRSHTLALLADGSVVGWGGDGSGRIPSGKPEYCTSKAPSGAVEVILREPLAGIAAGHGVSLGMTGPGPVVARGSTAARLGGGLSSTARPQ